MTPFCRICHSSQHCASHPYLSPPFQIVIPIIISIVFFVHSLVSFITNVPIQIATMVGAVTNLLIQIISIGTSYIDFQPNNNLFCSKFLYSFKLCPLDNFLLIPIFN
uniref:Uncharacterized protein n=1 Tax=Arundo donax TaxID=35708 RepID=A0A0A9CSK4_ARUDO